MTNIYTDFDEFNNKLLNGRLICLDIGMKKIGVAVSNQQCTISFPKIVIEHSKIKNLPSQLTDILIEEEVSGVVIGYPVGSINISREFSQLLDNFAKKISSLINKPILLYDERNTTKMANNILKEIGLNRRERNKIDDKIAASILLEEVILNLKKI